MIRASLVIAATLAFVPQGTGPGLPPQRTTFGVAPSRAAVDAAKTPTACLAAVRTEVAKLQRNAAAAPPSASMADEIARTRTDLAARCTARFDLKTTADAELASLIELYSVAGQGERMTAAVDRALGAKSLSAHDRALVLLQAVQNGLAEPESAARNTRLEGFIARLDALPDADAIDQKFTAHQRMSIFYRSQDLDAGLVKHSNWIIDTAKRSSPELRKKFTSAIVSAYVNMAQTWAGHGETDRAIALLRGVAADFPDIPSAPKSVLPDLERLQLVGTPAAAVKAPHWFNLPPGQTSLDVKGQVTLLEFSAHWCVPCKASYPVLVRLKGKFGAQGFRVVLATELYGFFERETKLTADAELARDRAYFKSAGLDVPIAVADGVQSQDDNPNATNYKVGGIPQIQLIDKRGIIRLVMVGFDKSNEATLATIIEGLLKER